jgi:hypothetical protein
MSRVRRVSREAVAAYPFVWIGYLFGYRGRSNREGNSGGPTRRCGKQAGQGTVNVRDHMARSLLTHSLLKNHGRQSMEMRSVTRWAGRNKGSRYGVRQVRHEENQPALFMTVRREIAESRGETGAWRLGTDTLHRVCAWCLSPSVPGQAPSRTTEPAPSSTLTDRAASPPARTELRAGLSQPRIGVPIALLLQWA